MRNKCPHEPSGDTATGGALIGLSLDQRIKGLVSHCKLGTKEFCLTNACPRHRLRVENE